MDPPLQEPVVGRARGRPTGSRDGSASAAGYAGRFSPVEAKWCRAVRRHAPWSAAPGGAATVRRAVLRSALGVASPWADATPGPMSLVPVLPLKEEKNGERAGTFLPSILCMMVVASSLQSMTRSMKMENEKYGCLKSTSQDYFSWPNPVSSRSWSSSSLFLISWPNCSRQRKVPITC